MAELDAFEKPIRPKRKKKSTKQGSETQTVESFDVIPETLNTNKNSENSQVIASTDNFVTVSDGNSNAEKSLHNNNNRWDSKCHDVGE